MKNLLFFGAGASHGAGHIEPKPPPLGKHLYEKLSNIFPNTWDKLPHEFKSELAKNFENGMEKIWKESDRCVPPLMQDMGCFFAHYRLEGFELDLYSQLILYLKDNGKIDEYIFSTINYECIIERALSLKNRKVFYDLDDINSHTQPVTPETSTLWKLHGSCNFILKNVNMQKSVPGVVTVNYGAQTTFNGTGIFPICPEDVLSYCRQSSLYPCMSLYAPGKPNQMGRDTIESIQRKWQSFVSEADKVIIIGVQPPTECNPNNDPHVWEYIAKCPGHLYYIGDAAAFENWVTKSQRKGKEYAILGETFEKSFQKLKKIL